MTDKRDAQLNDVRKHCASRQHVLSPFAWFMSEAGFPKIGATCRNCNGRVMCEQDGRLPIGPAFDSVCLNPETHPIMINFRAPYITEGQR